MKLWTGIFFSLGAHAVVSPRQLAPSLAPIPLLAQCDNFTEHCTLIVDMCTSTSSDVAFNTRCYNGNFVGPTIRVKAGTTFKISVVNKLQDIMNGDDKSMNWYREINTTGLHTHGLHTSPTAPGDDVETSILPMSPSAATAFQETFVYDLPANHMGGTFFYHGHHHGSSTNQAFTGMMGLLIVDDRDGEVPNYISAMPERLMVWNHVHLKALNSIQGYFIDSSDYDIIQQYPTTHDIDETFLVNGARNPLLSLVAGQWERWRIVFSSLEYGMFFTLDSASCEMQLLAKDGMYLPEAPRKVTRLPLYPAARADVAFRCDGSTRRVTLKAEIMDYNDDKGKKIISYPADFSGTILTLDVTPSTLQPADDIQSFEVFRPCYQATTLNAVADYVKPLEFSGLQINEQTYKVDSKNALGSLGVGKIVESVVHGIIVHAIHIHVNPFQLVDVPAAFSEDDVYFQVGDWHDTIQTQRQTDIKIRYFTDSFTGKMMVHCHHHTHSDRGMMNWYFINGIEGTKYAQAKILDPQCYEDLTRGYKLSMICPEAGMVGSPDGTHCTNCTAGQYSSASICRNCPTGTYSRSGWTDCRSCPAGKYQPALGGSECTDCKAGRAYSGTGGTTSYKCNSCSSGQYSNAGADFCTKCIAGQYQGSGGKAACTKCAANLESAVEGATSSSTCKECSAGFYSIEGSASCLLENGCPAGFYKAGLGPMNCSTCAPGTYSLAGARSCALCEIGKHQSAAGSAECQSCAAGHYSNRTGATSSGTCIGCPGGTYSVAVGLSVTVNCTLCPKGSAQPRTGSVTCLECDAGKYEDRSGSSACKFCLAGEYQTSKGALGCEMCVPGMYSSQTAASCESCPASTYQADVGASKCISCPEGTVQMTSRATNCVSVNPSKMPTNFPSPYPISSTQRPSPYPMSSTQRPSPFPISSTQRPSLFLISLTQRPTGPPAILLIVNGGLELKLSLLSASVAHVASEEFVLAAVVEISPSLGGFEVGTKYVVTNWVEMQRRLDFVSKKFRPGHDLSLDIGEVRKEAKEIRKLSGVATISIFTTATTEVLAASNVNNVDEWAARVDTELQLGISTGEFDRALQRQCKICGFSAVSAAVVVVRDEVFGEGKVEGNSSIRPVKISSMAWVFGVSVASGIFICVVAYWNKNKRSNSKYFMLDSNDSKTDNGFLTPATSIEIDPTTAPIQFTETTIQPADSNDHKHGRLNLKTFLWNQLMKTKPNSDIERTFENSINQDSDSSDDLDDCSDKADSDDDEITDLAPKFAKALGPCSVVSGRRIPPRHKKISVTESDDVHEVVHATSDDCDVTSP